MFNKILIIFFTISVSAVYGTSVGEGLVPKPNKIEVAAFGNFSFNANTCWLVENNSQRAVASQLSQMFHPLTGWDYKVKVSEKAVLNSVVFTTNKELASEAYPFALTPKARSSFSSDSACAS